MTNWIWQIKIKKIVDSFRLDDAWVHQPKWMKQSWMVVACMGNITSLHYLYINHTPHQCHSHVEWQPKNKRLHPFEIPPSHYYYWYGTTTNIVGDSSLSFVRYQKQGLGYEFFHARISATINRYTFTFLHPHEKRGYPPPIIHSIDKQVRPPVVFFHTSFCALCKVRLVLLECNTNNGCFALGKQ